MSIPDDELYEITYDIMIIKATAGILNDLTPAQMQMFDDAIKRG